MERSRPRRRTLLLGIGAVLVAPTVGAQSAKRPGRVGIAFNSNPESARPYFDAFVQGMDAHGYRRERDYVVDVRYAQGRNDRYPAIMADLLGAGVDVILVGPNTAVQAAKAATSTVPIVMATATDPDALGLVANLARPGGNVTGMGFNSVSLIGKRFQLLREILPDASRIAYLDDPKVPGHDVVMRGVEDAARALSFQLVPAEASSAEELDRALASIAALRPDGLVVSAAIVFWTHRKRIVDFCAQRRLPAVYANRESILDGGLISYAPNLTDSYRKAAAHVSRILGGAKPADLPVELATRFELIANMKTARALDIALPISLLARADEVIR